MENFSALSGLKVLDLSRLLPGPYCSMILADHGAHVIALEDQRFKAEGMYLKTLYRNKEHMTLNLKSKESRAILYRMVDGADVLLEGFRPGVVKKLGVDYDTLSKINPKLIYCSITGYGQTGPSKNEPGHDINYLSRAGVLNLIGEAGQRPVIPGIQIADIAGGAMNAVIGILMALQAREKTGEGQYIDISMTDGMLSFLTPVASYQKIFDHRVERGDWLLSHRYACYNTYETADGRYISIGAVENRFWKKLCEHLEVPEYGPLQYDDNSRQAIIDFMQNVFIQKTAAEWDKELSVLEICSSKIQTFSEVLDDPLFKEREMLVPTEGDHDDRQYTIGIPVKLNKTPGEIRTKPVNFGENTTSILSRLGYSLEEIQGYRNRDII